MKHMLSNDKLNILTVVWVLFCLKIAAPYGLSFSEIFYYLMLLFICILEFVKLYKGGIKSKTEYKILCCFIFLMMIQVIGTIQLFTLFSIRNIIAIFCILCFFDVLAFCDYEIEIVPIRIATYITFFFLGVRYALHEDFGNIVPGFIVFSLCAYALFEISYSLKLSSNELNKKRIYKIALWVVPIYAVAVAICYLSHARTSLLTLLIITFLYIFIICINPSKKKMRIFFFVLIAGVIGLIIVYTYIRSFSWYDNVNVYSVKMFGKNLDSSRPNLWRTSLESLNWWQIIIGEGPGKLPDVMRYRSASFHNSYIQLIMQSGVVGLLSLMFVFFYIWNCLIKHCDDLSIKLVLSVFVGVIVYNCFEVTLLQNKAFLGLLQWLILAYGVKRSMSLDFRKEV